MREVRTSLLPLQYHERNPVKMFGQAQPVVRKATRAVPCLPGDQLNRRQFSVHGACR
jgi:hypothetical protein